MACQPDDIPSNEAFPLFRRLGAWPCVLVVGLAAHEFGHAVHYESNPADFLENSNNYSYLEVKADQLRGNVLEQLRLKRISIYGSEDPFEGTGFCAAEHDRC